MYPNIGNNVFTKFENPTWLITILVMQSILENSVKFSWFFDISFRKLIPAEIAVVNIAIKITIPYRYLNFANLLFTT